MGQLEYHAIWEAINLNGSCMSVFMIYQATGLSILVITNTLKDKRYRNFFVEVFPGVYKLKSTPEINLEVLAKPLLKVVRKKPMLIVTIASIAKTDRTITRAIITKSSAKRYFKKVGKIGSYDLYTCS
jgi:hypothetical protein